MKQIAILCLLLCTSYGFSQNNNLNYCRKNIEGNTDYAVLTKFYIGRQLNDNEIIIIKSNLLEKQSIYKVELNSKKTELFVYHLSKIHFEDIKVLVKDISVELNYISTQNTNFEESLNIDRYNNN